MKDSITVGISPMEDDCMDEMKLQSVDVCRKCCSETRLLPHKHALLILSPYLCLEFLPHNSPCEQIYSKYLVI